MQWREMLVANHIYIGLYKLPVATILGALTSEHLINGIAAVGEGELAAVGGYVASEWDCVIKREGKIGGVVGTLGWVQKLQAIELGLDLAVGLGGEYLCA